MFSIVLCPGGNAIYMSSGDAFSAIVVTCLVTGVVLGIGFVIAYEIREEFKPYVFGFLGMVLAFAVLNIWQFLQFL